MTANQIKMYRAEWAKARLEIEKKRGSMTSAQADTCRRQIHADVGAPDSSKDFNNKDLDAVLSAFFAWSRSDDLLSQLHLQDQPEIRARYLADDMLDRIEAILDTSGREQEADKIRKGQPREAYLLFLLRRLNPKSDIPIMDSAKAKDWQQVIRTLVYRHDQVVRRKEALKQTIDSRRGLLNPVDSSRVEVLVKELPW
ncbi:MAG: hypothetical protein AAGJ81_16000 [Verrucomicrobiota bacterium]